MTSLMVGGGVVLAGILSVWAIKSLAARKATLAAHHKALQEEIEFEKKAKRIREDRRHMGIDDVIDGL